ncbi:MAG: response regulator [Bacillota bacterium]
MSNILLIEDSSFLRHRIKMLLKNYDFNICEAKNSFQVKKETFAQNKDLATIDLVLLDTNLNGEDGLDLLPYLKENYPALPVIIISDDNNKQTVLKTFNLKANDYILKPFKEKNLIDKINYYLAVDDECIINPKLCPTQKEITNKDNKVQNEFNYFKVQLLTEINRSLRSNLPFSIFKLSLNDNSNHKITKDQLLNLIRTIDHLYTLNQTNYLFLLPLTSKPGMKTLIDRLKTEFKDLTADDTINFANQLSFPQDITNQLQQDNAVKYQQAIIDELI